MVKSRVQIHRKSASFLRSFKLSTPNSPTLLTPPIRNVRHEKKTPFEFLNPNGRVPAITDPNTGITLWESSAIIEYLAATYDKSSKLTYTSSPEKYYVSQWLYFQVSGQGPYFGQTAWFHKFHSEQVERRRRGMRSSTIADLSFVAWNMMVPFIFGDQAEELQIEKNYPRYFKWNQKLIERPAVKKIVQDKQKAMSGH
ncbi:hypothetical protein G7Y89_g2216 [Cudoniella acicularis]|uniref:GST N-terminal domain-containing protein n=1 Tax=Cudoniella acicularis TaxID=354080 RepID=A0A8H4W772_9HELO|nr:hypothetical protein G7Y89_g2216 [Cudoniella acicularis]